ncbi:hypothetical protein OB920_20760 [Halobacteria archaeon HArc-gm2]|nr:hypothetical protein [Halobacteria archaeon HArc-gm2]
MGIKFDRYVVISLFAGLANVVALHVARYVLLSAATFELDGVLTAVLAVVLRVGLFAMGAVPAYLLVRYRLVTPTIWSAILTRYALVDQHSMEPFAGFYMFPPVQFIALGVTGALAAIELLARHELPVISNDPLI